MKIELSNKLKITGAPPALESEIKTTLTLKNPKWIENNERGYSNWQTPEYLRSYRPITDGLTLPRGFTAQLLAMCADGRRSAGEVPVEDRRRTMPATNYIFANHLKPFQKPAVEAILRKDFGVLSAPPGSGKTVIALYTIAERQQPTLVIVHTKELLHQWVDRIHTFLDIPKPEIGIIGGGKHTIGRQITVALVQSLYKITPPHVGYLIIDEVHRSPSRTFTEAIGAFDSRYMLGLSATPWRRDKLTQLIGWHIGPIVHTIKPKPLVDTGDILQARVVIRKTSFRTSLDPTLCYSKMIAELTMDEERNNLIADDVAAANGNGIRLILSDRKQHCRTLQDQLKKRGVEAELLTGDMPDGERSQVVDRLRAGKANVLVATGQLIGEGFDLPNMQTLFLATPVKFDGRILQYLGRVMRPAPGKREAVIYDYVDQHVGVLIASAKSRRKVYADV